MRKEITPEVLFRSAIKDHACTIDPDLILNEQEIEALANTMGRGGIGLNVSPITDDESFTDYRGGIPFLYLEASTGSSAPVRARAIKFCPDCGEQLYYN